jgi:hypothetical protein
LPERGWRILGSEHDDPAFPDRAEERHQAGRVRGQATLRRRHAQRLEHDLAPHRFAQGERVRVGGDLDRAALGQHGREPPAGPGLRQRRLEHAGELMDRTVLVVTRAGCQDERAVVQFEQRQPAAGAKLPEERVDRLAERRSGGVHEHPLGPDEVERSGGEVRVGEIGMYPGEVRTAGSRAPLGFGEQVGVLVQAGDVCIGVVGGDPGGLQADAAAGVQEPGARPRLQGPPHRTLDGLHPAKPIGLLQERGQCRRDRLRGIAESDVEIAVVRSGHGDGIAPAGFKPASSLLQARPGP